MKHLYFLQTLCYMLLCAVGFTACSSDADDVIGENGIGYVSLALNADTGFKTTTKAVDESEYENVDDYTVQIFKEGVQQGEDKIYKDIKGTLIELSRGSYTVKAFKGEDLPVSTESMFVTGSKDVNIANKVVEVSFECKPVNAKVKVIFDPTMEQYFDDYSVDFKTTALGEGKYTWEKTFTNPVYLKVVEKENVKAIINLKTKDGVKAKSSITRDYELSPLVYKTITIKPTLSSGSLGIEISIDEGTNDTNVDIEVPSDWV